MPGLAPYFFTRPAPKWIWGRLGLPSQLCQRDVELGQFKRLLKTFHLCGCGAFRLLFVSAVYKLSYLLIDRRVVNLNAHQIFIAQLSKLSELLGRQEVRFAYRRAHLALYCQRQWITTVHFARNLHCMHQLKHQHLAVQLATVTRSTVLKLRLDCMLLLRHFAKKNVSVLWKSGDAVTSYPWTPLQQQTERWTETETKCVLSNLPRVQCR